MSSNKMVLCCDYDKLDLAEVYEVLGSYTDEKLTEDRRLGDLGVGDSAQWLGIFHDLKIPYMKFTSGGTLTEEGRQIFYKIAEKCKGEDVAYLENVARSQDTLRAIKMLDIGDLVRIKNYAEINLE